MPSVCLYFQVHQPYRLRRYSYFDIGNSPDYFDDALNRSVMERVAARCYVPANRVLLELIKRHEGAFKVAFSITGTAIEQMKLYSPGALESFKELAATGCVEFLGETYYHSLSMLYDQREYREQVRQHKALIQAEFGQKPKVLRNTELLYSDELGKLADDLGFDGVVAEGLDEILGWRSPNFLYRVPEKSTRILLKNYKLSDDIAFRFTSGSPTGTGTLRSDVFAGWLHGLTGNADFVGLFLDYETFGEHHTDGTGIFEFLSTLPEEVLKQPEWKFHTPSEAMRMLTPAGDLSFSRLTSWADTERDASAWCGNKMQEGSLGRIYAPRELCAGREMYSTAMEDACETWRRLQTSDHFYYMSTKGLGDGVVHSYFSPFESPYDAFIAYNNVLRDFSSRCQGRGAPLRIGQAV